MRRPMGTLTAVLQFHFTPSLEKHILLEIFPPQAVWFAFQHIFDLVSPKFSFKQEILIARKENALD